MIDGGSMPAPTTLKQLETIYWIANLGTFERAALNHNDTWLI